MLKIVFVLKVHLVVLESWFLVDDDIRVFIENNMRSGPASLM